MSYRDLRNFTEMMRALGYHRLISMENFRTPNFPLVAEILIWLVHRFEPDADIHTEFGTEEDRVLLVRSVAQFMAVSADVKLNTKWVYQADGYAVKELLKIASLLYTAFKTNHEADDRNHTSHTSSLDIMPRVTELKATRELASRITAKGASLYQLLGKEPQLREERVRSISSQVELATVEEGLREAIEAAKASLATTRTAIDSIAATEASLDAKIEKRQQDLERNQKRLQTLKKVRPAFLEEFERLEVELRRLYQDYITRFRCVSFLEQQLEETEAAEHERSELRQAATRKMMAQMRQDEALKLLEESESLEAHSQVPGQGPPHQLTAARPSPAPRVSRVRTATGRRIYGGMTGDDDSLDSDSDLLLDDDDDDNSHLLASEDDLELLEPGITRQSDHSDDNF